MAITVNQTANSPALGYNKMLYTLDSTNKAQANFKYIADVYVNNSPDYIRLKKPAHPVSGYSAFDLQGVIQDYFNVDVWIPNTSGVVTCPNSIVEYDVRWGEEYGPSSGVVTYQNLSSSLNKYAISASLDEFVIDAGRSYAKYNYYEYADTYLYLRTNFLTDGNNFHLTLNDDFVLDFYQDNTYNDTSYIGIDVTDVYGNVITYAINNNQYPSNTKDKKRVRVYCGPRNLNSSALVVGSQPVIDSKTVKYTVYTCQTDLTKTNNEKTFILDNDCNRTEYIRITFLNQWGGYDSFNCYGGYVENYNYQRSEFKKSNYIWSGTSYGFDPTERAKTQFNNEIDYSIKVYTGWMTEDESKFVENMFRSKDVRAVDTSRNLCVPINLKTNTYTKKTYSRDGLFQYEFEFTPSFTSNVQKW